MPPRPTPSTWIIDPSPPAIKDILSPVEYKLPSFVIVGWLGIPDIWALIKISLSSEDVPRISSLTENVPVILSAFNINSDISSTPIWNLKTFSTTAFASEVCPSIVLPTKSTVLPAVVMTLNILLVFHLPSDILNNCSLGNIVSDSRPNNILKNIWWPTVVPFNLYKDLMFLIRFLLLILVFNSSGIVFKNSFLNLVKKFDIALSGSLKFNRSCMLFTGLGL